MKQHIHSLRLCQTLLVVALLGQAQMAHAFNNNRPAGSPVCYEPGCYLARLIGEKIRHAPQSQAPQIQKTTTRLSQGFVHLRGEVIKQRQARAACNAASGANGSGCTPP